MKAIELTVTELASNLGISQGALWALARNPEKMFLPTRKRKVGNKFRDIDAPHYWAKVILRKLHRFILKNFEFQTCVHGGLPRHSCFSSAEKHLGRSYLVVRDITDAYPSIRTESLRSELRNFGFREDVSHLLSMLMTLHNRVPQGSPISSDALNFYMAAADKAIQKRCSKQKNTSYTRVFDDFAISTNSRKKAEVLGEFIEENVNRIALIINNKKKRINGFQTSYDAQKIHNIAVGNPLGTRIVDEQKFKALYVADLYVRAARRVTPDSIPTLAKTREKLNGWIHHTAQASFGPAKHLRRQLDAGDRLVRKILEPLGLLPPNGRWWVKSKRTTPNKIANAWRNRGLKMAA